MGKQINVWDVINDEWYKLVLWDYTWPIKWADAQEYFRSKIKDIEDKWNWYEPVLNVLWSGIWLILWWLALWFMLFDKVTVICK